jgi:hypothetical protein
MTAARPKPKYITNIVPGHALPSFHFGYRGSLIRPTLGKAHGLLNSGQNFWFRVKREAICFERRRHSGHLFPRHLLYV